jgi:hypothetical protein
MDPVHGLKFNCRIPPSGPIRVIDVRKSAFGAGQNILTDLIERRQMLQLNSKLHLLLSEKSETLCKKVYL